LTPAEKNWLEEHPVIRVSSDPTWPPFAFVNEQGHFSGYDAELMELLAAKLGVAWEYVPASTWMEAVSMAASGRVDILTGTAASPEREEILVFTGPYLSFPVALITDIRAPFNQELEAMDGQWVALPEGYITTQHVMRDYPRLNFRLTSNSEQAMRLVSQGRAQFVVENIATASYIIKNKGYTNLKIAGVTDYVFDLRMGVRRDAPLLCSALQKALDSVDASQRSRLLDRWISVEDVRVRDRDRLWRAGVAVLLAGGLVAAVILAWNRLLARELERRAKVEAELKGAKESAERANEEKTRLLAMAAHDLKNPLTTILLRLEMVELLGHVQHPHLREVHDGIRKSANYMVNLIQNLLDAQAIDSGNLRLHDQPVELPLLLKEVCERLQPAARGREVSLEIEEDLEAGHILGDHEAAQRVLENLVSNAIKFSPPGAAVLIRTESAEAKVRVQVRDQGPGIAEEDRTRLFERYTRLGKRPSGLESSHGLGLYIVRELMTQMGGRVWHEASGGRGAAFWLEFKKGPESAGLAG
jgi:polar amino acid transport system substrate-binding protein